MTVPFSATFYRLNHPSTSIPRCRSCLVAFKPSVSFQPLGKFHSNSVFSHRLSREEKYETMSPFFFSSTAAASRTSPALHYEYQGRLIARQIAKCISASAHGSNSNSRQFRLFRIRKLRGQPTMDSIPVQLSTSRLIIFWNLMNVQCRFYCRPHKALHQSNPPPPRSPGNATKNSTAKAVSCNSAESVRWKRAPTRSKPLFTLTDNSYSLFENPSVTATLAHLNISLCCLIPLFTVMIITCC